MSCGLESLVFLIVSFDLGYLYSLLSLESLLSYHVDYCASDALEQHQLVLEAVPYMLSVSPLDCEALNVMYGFDFTYRGNQNQLVAEALGIVPAFERLMDHPGATVISNEPSIQFALDEECRVQCRLSIETRTSAFHVRTGDYPEDQLSVYITARRYGSLDPGETFVDVMYRLNEICEEFVNGYVVDNVLQPLYQTIAIK